MNILITGAFKYSPLFAGQIKDLGHSIVDMPLESEQLPIAYDKIDATICNGLFLHHDIKKFKNLKYIQLTSAGLDRVPLEYITANGIKLYNARGVYSIPMAEWVIMRILEIYKSLEKFLRHQKSNEWSKERNLREIAGSKIAIIGAGNVGQEIAKRLIAFDGQLTGFDIHENSISNFDCVKHISRLKNEIQDYDIIILTAPHTPETDKLIDEEMLLSMKPGTILINISRGSLIDEKSLIKVLTSRRDLFAILDVFENEPLSKESKLWNMENVRISPHNSFVGNGNQKRLSNVIINNLKSYTNGI